MKTVESKRTLPATGDLPDTRTGHTRRSFLGVFGRSSLAIVAGLSGMMLRTEPAAGHNQDCTLALAHNPYCAYNCWKYAGYNGYSWVSPSGHNWCFECTTGSSCWEGSFLCSQWGHM